MAPLMETELTLPAPAHGIARTLQRRRDLVVNPREHLGHARTQFEKHGTVMLPTIHEPHICSRILRMLPSVQPVLATRILEPSHRQDLPVYSGGYVSSLIDTTWKCVAPVLEPIVGPDPEVVELSCMISFPGAKQQAPHPDVRQEDGQAEMLSIFIPLCDQTYDMGPLLVWPGTQNGTPPELPMRDVVPMFSDAGSVILMNSKVYHCGGANVSNKPRPVLYFTLKGDGPMPGGSTRSILPELSGQRLSDFVPKF